MGSTSEESALYASANREHFSVLDRLEEISKRKINPNYIKQNINQQAGYSAEIKEQAHVNAHNILAKKGERVWQYDDLSSERKAQVKKLTQTMPRPVRTTKSWIISVWMKRGMSFLARLCRVNLWAEMVKSVFKKLLSKPYKKYFENGAKMNVPKDYYRDIQKATDAEIKKLES
ncbi:hypothetical protein BD0133_02850 [Helicobacter pylori]